MKTPYYQGVWERWWGLIRGLAEPDDAVEALREGVRDWGCDDHGFWRVTKHETVASEKYRARCLWVAVEDQYSYAFCFSANEIDTHSWLGSESLSQTQAIWMMKTRGLSRMSLKKDGPLPQMLRIFNIGRFTSRAPNPTDSLTFQVSL